MIIAHLLVTNELEPHGTISIEVPSMTHTEPASKKFMPCFSCAWRCLRFPFLIDATGNCGGYQTGP
jgi:hypothetical protein